MTITTNDDRDEYTATAGQTVFNYTFKIYSTTDLNVYQTPAVRSFDDAADIITGYTVSGVGSSSGGTITLNTGAAAGDRITIVSAIPSSRTTDYQNNGDFTPATVNDDFDRAVSLIKQAEGIGRRALLFPESQQNTTALTLPEPEALRLVRWKNDLSGLENTGLPTITVSQSPETTVDDTSAMTAISKSSLVSNQRIVTLGYAAPGDGGANEYYWDASSTTTADNVFYFASDEGGAGRFIAVDRTYVLVEQAGAVGDWNIAGTGTDNTAAFQRAFDACSRVGIGDGFFRIAGRVTIEKDGFEFLGNGDLRTAIIADGSTEWLRIGPATQGSVYSQFKFGEFNQRTGPNFSASRVIHMTAVFQVYIQRYRYVRQQKKPTKCVFDLDGLLTEAPVRVVLRDCYFDGEQYDFTPKDAVSSPAVVWNRAGIQVIFDNTHVQDFKYVAELGVDPASGDYSAGITASEDVMFVNNSRFQATEAAYLGGDADEVAAFLCWDGNNLFIDNSTIYLNNLTAANPAPPGVPEMTIARFEATWGHFAMTNTTVNLNARTDQLFTVSSGASVERLFHDSNNYINSKSITDHINLVGTATVVEGVGNNYANPNAFNGLTYLLNSEFSSGSAFDLSRTRAYVIDADDASSKVLNEFTGGAIGVTYEIKIKLSGGSSLEVQFNSGANDAFASGLVNRTYRALDGDILYVRKNPERPESSDKAYTVQVVSPSHPAMSFVADGDAGWRDVVSYKKNHTDSAGLKLQMFTGTTNVRVLNEQAGNINFATNNVDHWILNSSGNLVPATTGSRDIGSSTVFGRTSYFNQMAIADGVTAPTTVAGVAFLYVDSADGDLKVKFGDGTVKTIATDT